MRTITRTVVLPVSADQAWNTILDVKNYSKSMKFIKKVTVKSDLILGGEWEDLHTIIFIPLSTNHRIITFKKPKLLIYDLDLPFNWEMREKIEIQSLEKSSKIAVTVDYDLKNRFLEKICGRIFEHRLSQVILSGFEYYKAQKSKPF